MTIVPSTDPQSDIAEDRAMAVALVAELRTDGDLDLASELEAQISQVDTFIREARARRSA